MQKFFFTAHGYPRADRIRLCEPVCQVLLPGGSIFVIANYDPPWTNEEVGVDIRLPPATRHRIGVKMRVPGVDFFAALQKCAAVEVAVFLPDSERNIEKWAKRVGEGRHQFEGEAYAVGHMPQAYRVGWELHQLTARGVRTAGNWSVAVDDGQRVSVISHEEDRGHGHSGVESLPVTGIRAEFDSDLITLDFNRFFSVQMSRLDCLRLHQIFQTFLRETSGASTVPSWRSAKWTMRLRWQMGDRTVIWVNDRAFEKIYMYIQGGNSDFALGWAAVAVMAEMTHFVVNWCSLNAPTRGLNPLARVSAQEQAYFKAGGEWRKREP
jgi:hypothetical protein